MTATAVSITIAHSRNAPRTSTERYQVKYWRKVEMECILSYFFSSQNGKTWKVQPEFVKFRTWVPVVSIMISLLFSASLHVHWHCYLNENGPLLRSFRCCKCVFVLLNFWSDSRDSVPLIYLLITCIRGNNNNYYYYYNFFNSFIDHYTSYIEQDK